LSTYKPLPDELRHVFEPNLVPSGPPTLRGVEKENPYAELPADLRSQFEPSTPEKPPQNSQSSENDEATQSPMPSPKPQEEPLST